MSRVIRFLTPTGAMQAWWALVVTIVALGSAVGLSIGYTARSVQRSDRQWCDLLRSLDQPLPSGSPASERAVRFARQIHALREGKGC